MKFNWVGLIELFVVLLFAVGWGLLELLVLRMDRRREGDQASHRDGAGESAGESRHTERQ